MTDPTTYRTNRDLFSNYYLNDHLHHMEAWTEIPDTEVETAFSEIKSILDKKGDRVEDYNEAQLERNVIRPIFEILEIPFEIEETVMRNARRPDYGFFPSAEAADAAFDRENFYQEAIAVADAKRWGRKLDTRGEEKRDFENPSYQIHSYLQETPPQWGVLTNGEKWRLYYGPTSHRLDSYYEIDLPKVLSIGGEGGDLEAFKEFYLFFRQGAFLDDQTGDCFLDDVYDQSTAFAEALGEDLQENIYEAIRVLAEGFLETNDNLDEEDLDRIHDSSLIYLYRLIFVLYAESEGRNLLPTENEIYSETYSLNDLKQVVVEKRDETQQHYQTWQTSLWDKLDELFVLIDQGSQGKGIPKDDLYIPAYNGGLFRTDPEKEDTIEAQFLSNHEVGDTYIAEVIELLTRHEASEGQGKVFVDYSSLDERNLGSIYEGLLEYTLAVADEPLTVDDGEYVAAGEGDDVTVEQGEVYLRTDDGERKATGSYYTPEYVVEYIVDETLGPLVQEIREDLVANSARGDDRGFAEEFADRVFDLTVLDPAMGSGHFPVNAVDYLAREIIDAQEQQDRQALDSADAEIRAPTTEEGELRDINWARRKVAQRCIYGVDVNPLATELAKVSLWLRTLAAEQPLAFLDHHLKTGNSLVGSDIEDVLSDGDEDATGDGQLTLQQSFDHTRQRAMEHVTDRFQDLLNIDNETLEDAKEMEAVYDDVRADPLYKKLLAMANVHTADAFGLDVPSDADERMARALHSDAWEKIEQQDWFKSAQAMAEDERFFHWELEFPMAFYDQDGERHEDAGFDAVIGNPPYINANEMNKSGFSEQKEYWKDKYETSHGAYDIYILFFERSTELLSNGKRLGLITPNKFLSAPYAEHLRKFIAENHSLSKICDVSQVGVFSDVSVYPIITFIDSGEKTQNIEIVDGNGQGYTAVGTYQSDVLYRLPDLIWGFLLSEGLSIVEKIGNETITLGEYSEVVASTTAAEADEYSPAIQEWDRHSDDLMKLVNTGIIDRYVSTWGVEKLTHQGNSYEKPSLDINHDSVPQRRIDQYRNSKLIFAKLGKEVEAMVDHSGGYASVNTNFVIDSSPNIKLLAAICNSSLITWIYEQYFGALRMSGGYLQFQAPQLKAIPIPKSNLSGITEQYEENTDRLSEQADVLVDEGLNQPEEPEPTHSAVVISLVDLIIKYKNKRANINPDLLSELGSSENTENLMKMGTAQTIAERNSTLHQTTDEHDNLRAGKISTERISETVVEIHETARYKPEDEERYETDTWGYTETEALPALRISGLSKIEADLIETFVPVAADEAGGFAGFRETATKTNSLLDRLKPMQLPDSEDVADDLRRYIETKERADKLDEKIEKTDQLIDEIVYDLYDLTDEEIEIVQEAVAED